MKISAVYMRMSTDRQEHSIESQRRVIKDFALKNGYQIVKYYSDEGISGRDAEKRPAFLQMIDDSSNREFSYVLIYDSSRFARNLEQSLVYKSVLRKNNVTLVSVTEPSLDEDTSLITDALFGAMNEMYSRKLSKNVHRGREQKALRGEYNAPSPYGYVFDKVLHKLVADEKEAPIVAWMFAEALKNRSAYSLAHELREKGLRTKKGSLIDRRRVDYILSNPVYKGYLRFGNGSNTIICKSNHEGIISESDFEKVQTILEQSKIKSKTKGQPKEIFKHWLGGILRCSECGSTYIYHKGSSGRSPRYRCSGQSKGHCSSSISFRVQDITYTVINSLRIITRSSSVPHNFILVPKAAPTINYDAEIKKIEKSLSRAKKSYLSGIDTIEEYAEIKKNLTSEIEKLQKQKDCSQPQDFNFEEYKQRIKNALEIIDSDLPDILKKQALHDVVEKIVINKIDKSLLFYFYG